MVATVALLVFAAVVPDRSPVGGDGQPVNRRAAHLLSTPRARGQRVLLARDAQRMTEIADRLDLQPVELSRRATPTTVSPSEVTSLIAQHGVGLALLDDRDPVASGARLALHRAGFEEVAVEPPFTILVAQ
jgi:hypothetical protein